jgi:hypothetical protein
VKAVFTPARVKQIADMLAERKGVIRAREEVLSKLMVGFEKGQKPEFVLKYFVDGRVVQKAPVTPKKAASKGKTTKK